MRELFSKGIFLGFSALIWELVRFLGNYPPLLLPGVLAVWESLWGERAQILAKTLVSLKIIGVGLFLAVSLAMLATLLTLGGKVFSDTVSNLVAIMHPLPGIAILPIAILWFGIGTKAISFVIVFSAIWPLINYFHTGFRSIPASQLEVGKNLGLSDIKLAFTVMLPASFPHILGGLRNGWARAWQASVAAELVFGAAGGQGGLGWYLYKKRFMMETPGVFAGMVVIVLIGLGVEYLIFVTIEKNTIRKWKTILD